MMQDGFHQIDSARPIYLSLNAFPRIHPLLVERWLMKAASRRKSALASTVDRADGSPNRAKGPAWERAPAGRAGPQAARIVVLRLVEARTDTAPHPRPFPHKLHGGRENSIPLRHPAERASTCPAPPLPRSLGEGSTAVARNEQKAVGGEGLPVADGERRGPSPSNP